MADVLYRGSCMCGSVRFEIEAPLGPFGFCHCNTCRKASGTAFTANSSVPRDKVRFLNGEGTIRRYESSPGTFRCFCSNCGSPVYKESPSKPGVIRIRLGLLDTPVGDKPRAHTFWSEKADWYELKGDMPAYDTWITEPKVK
ncbi:MAG: GFA family protein [Parvibaculum sp.]|uniref:GFA family protein n=1 Tax=Parvibaculum sp. TaxID=2024848 RepID=UPI003919EC9E